MAADHDPQGEQEGVVPDGPDDGIIAITEPEEMVAKIKEIAGKATLADREWAVGKKSGGPVPNASLWLRYDTGKLVLNHYRDVAQGGSYGQNVFEELSKLTGNALAPTSLRQCANYALLSTEEVRRHVEDGLPWRKAAKKAKGKFVAWRKSLDDDSLEL